MALSDESRTECGGILTLVGDRLLSFVVKSSGFKEILLVDVAPVVAPRAALAESLVHTRLGLGSVLDYGTGRERTFGASHDGRWVRDNASIGRGFYIITGVTEGRARHPVL